jgi:hypothetical protein
LLHLKSHGALVLRLPQQKLIAVLPLVDFSQVRPHIHRILRQFAGRPLTHFFRFTGSPVLVAGAPAGVAVLPDPARSQIQGLVRRPQIHLAGSGSF